MFQWFKRKSRKVSDIVWSSTSEKWKACIARFRVDESVHFVAWFRQSKTELEKFAQQNGISSLKVSMAHQVTHVSHLEGLVFIEHHPLNADEEAVYTRLQLENVTVYSALDEPLFQFFGGERIISLMKKMGMKEEEAIEHKMISSSIKNIQKKIKHKTLINIDAPSQADWLLNADLK